MYSHRYFGEIDPPSFVPALSLVIGVIFVATLHSFIAIWLKRVLSTTQCAPGLSSPHDQPRPVIPHEQPCPLLHVQLCPALPHEQPCGQPRKGKVSQHATIETLPDDVLIEIFGAYRLVSMTHLRGRPWQWHSLVHVCQRWRTIVFASPHHLDLRLFCTYGSPVRDTLCCWPALPIVMRYGGFSSPSPLATGDEDNIAFALQHPIRVCIIQLTVTIPLLERLATQSQEPFPTLEHLELVTQTETGLTLPSNCFGGAAPLLRVLRTAKIGFPALPQLLLSAEDLVSLQLEAIPSTGYISPRDLIVCLAKLTRLTLFHLHFLSPTSRANLREPPPLQRRAVLPALKYFAFHGVSEYLESLLPCVDAPLLKYIYITLFNQAIFRIPNLVQFINRTESQWSHNEATVYSSEAGISISLSQLGAPHHVGLRVSCRPLDWQISSMAEICANLLPILSGVHRLDISASSPLPSGEDDEGPLTPNRQDDRGTVPAPELFDQFPNVEKLRVTKEAVSHVVHVLSTNALPSLRELYIEGGGESAVAQRDLERLITTCQSYGRPVTIYPWEPNSGLQPPAGDGRSTQTDTPAPSPPISDPILLLKDDVRDIGEQFGAHPRPFAVQSLFRQAQSLLLSFMQSGRVEELENAIEISQDLLEMHTKQIPRIKLLAMLAFSFALSRHRPGNRAESISMFEAAFQDEYATTAEKLGIGWWWATFARVWGHPSTTLAYQNTLSALQSSLIGGFTAHKRPVSIGRLGSKIQIPFEYASYQIERGQLELAIETIEQGKMSIWSEMYGLRTFVGRLRRDNPGLANRLASVSRALEVVNTSISAHGATGSPLYLGQIEDHHDIGVFDPTLNEQRKLLLECQEVIQEIQDLTDFKNFMKAIPFRTLQNAASRGPIIIINHCRWRCDFLIVLRDSPPSLVPTTEGFYEDANDLVTRLRNAGSGHLLESTHYRKALSSVLEGLHQVVGEPVLRRLQDLGIPKKSRIWWCPTSVFYSLPLHAMGPIPSTDGLKRHFLDLYVCSYTPTLRVLMEAHSPAAPTSDIRPSLLFVGQRSDNLPGVAEEREAVKDIGIPVTMLVQGDATWQALIDGLQEHPLVHIASHTVYGEDLFDKVLKLGGSDRLALLDIVRSRVPTTEVAFLSACRTAEPGHDADLVEGLHLAAAMQCYGFGSVIGTMWAMNDGDGAELSRSFYRHMFSRRADDDIPLKERVARSLRYAVQDLRKQRGATGLERWVNFVHYGA